MTGMSKYLEQQIITTSLVTPTWPGSGTRYVALFTADPVDDPTVNAYELSSATHTWYARVACSSWQAAVVSGTAATTSNQATVTFTAVGTSDPSVTITHFGIYDAATSGNMLYSGALSPNKTLSAGDVLSFAVGAITLSFD